MSTILALTFVKRLNMIISKAMKVMQEVKKFDKRFITRIMLILF